MNAHDKILLKKVNPLWCIHLLYYRPPGLISSFGRPTPHNIILSIIYRNVTMLKGLHNHPNSSPFPNYSQRSHGNHLRKPIKSSPYSYKSFTLINW